METRDAIVVNDQGYKVTYVLVNTQIQDGKVKEIPEGYILQAGESLIYEDIATALPMTKAHWNPEARIWEETATQEDIQAAQTARTKALRPFM